MIQNLSNIDTQLNSIGNLLCQSPAMISEFFLIDS